MNTLTHYTALNLVFLLTCIPILTIGTAVTSLYGVTLKYIENEDIPLVRTYLKNFKSDFKQSFIAFLIVLIIGSVIGFNFAFWRKFSSSLSTPILVLLTVVTLLIVFALEFLFPLLATYQNSLTQTFKNAFLVSIASFFKTLLLLAIDATALAVFYLSGFVRVLLLIFGFAFIVYLKSFIIRNIFAHFDPENFKKR